MTALIALTPSPGIWSPDAGMSAFRVSTWLLNNQRLTRLLGSIVHGYAFEHIRELASHTGAEQETTGDTKAGTLIGKDLYGNKYYENNADLPRTAQWIYSTVWERQGLMFGQ